LATKTPPNKEIEQQHAIQEHKAWPPECTSKRQNRRKEHVFASYMVPSRAWLSRSVHAGIVPTVLTQEITKVTANLVQRMLYKSYNNIALKSSRWLLHSDYEVHIVTFATFYCMRLFKGHCGSSPIGTQWDAATRGELVT